MKLKFFFITITLLFSFIIIEIFFQFFYYFSVGTKFFERVQTPIFEKDEYQCAKFKNNLNYLHATTEYKYTIKTNEKGYRVVNNNADSEIINNKKKIIFLGPSFGAGQGVEYNKSYAYLLSERLKNDFNSVNSSTPAMPINANLCWLLNNITNEEEITIIQTIYGISHSGVNNQYSKENCKNFCININISKEGYLKTSSQSNFISFVINISKQSATIFYLWEYLTKYFSNNITTSISFEELHKQIGKSYYEHSNDLNEIKKSYENYISNVRIVNSKAKIYFVYIPYNFLTSDKYLFRWKHKNLNLEEILEMDKYFRSMMKSNFSFIDPSLKLIETESKQNNYYTIDVHLTENGNQVIYEEILKYLKNN